MPLHDRSLLSLRFPRLAAAVAATALVVGACGGGDGSTSDLTASARSVSEANDAASENPPAAEDAPAPETPEESAAVPEAAEASAPEPEADEPEPAAPPAEAPNNQLPDVDVVDIATGAEVNLRTLAPANKPIVLWFWAPH